MLVVRTLLHREDGTTSGMSSPYRQPTRQASVVTGEQVHVVQPPPQDDATVRQVADILLAGTSAVAAASLIAALLGLPKRAVLIAVSMTRGPRSTAPKPYARHKRNGNGNRGAAADFARAIAAIDVYYRAAYVINAARRISDGLSKGEKVGKVYTDELRNYDMHEQARTGRLDAASRLGAAVAEHGNLLGWYLDPELNNEIECIRANGNNFYANRPPIIGLPGLVHPRCGCFGGAPHFGGGMVDDATADVIRLGDAATPLPVKTRRAG